MNHAAHNFNILVHQRIKGDLVQTQQMGGLACADGVGAQLPIQERHLAKNFPLAHAGKDTPAR